MIATFGRTIVRTPSLYAALITSVVTVCLLVIGLEGWHSRASRTITIAADKVETENLVRSLSQHTHDLIQAVDVVLVDIREGVEVDGMASTNLERLHLRMVQDIKTVPMIHGVFVYDVTGDWTVNSLSMKPSSQNNSDRDYFNYHRHHTDDAVHIGVPVHSKSDGSWIVTISRRINAPDGMFAGVVLATVSIDALRQFYATFDVGGLGAITLLSSAGIVIAREPSGDAQPGTDLSGSQVFQEFLPRSPIGSFRSVYAVDGVTRLGSYRKIDDYPLIIVVAHGLDDVLVSWRSDAYLHFAISAGSVLMLAILGCRLAGQIKRTQRAERRYRLLADNASDAILCVAMNGQRLYLSPAFVTLTGWSITDGLGQPWQRFVHPDDRATIEGLQTQSHILARPMNCEARYLRKDGTHRWAEARIQLLPATDSEGAQYVATIRDITERRLAEDEVTSLHRELERQATTDGLTGLANRRQFDQALEDEWRRAAREKRSLSLLMIDVDRFKLYNDRYGHPRGDQCLRAIAATIARCGRRAGDMAARYGGEEFASLLPGADAMAASALAEHLRAAIEALGLEHADNTPSGFVTASIGAATMNPVPDNHAVPRDLVIAADIALYEAKHAGRNRVATRAIPDAALGSGALSAR